jgi:hypothetical protein
VWRISWPWQAWLDVIAFLRASQIDYCRAHADLIQCSVNVARWKLDLALPDRSA